MSRTNSGHAGRLPTVLQPIKVTLKPRWTGSHVEGERVEPELEQLAHWMDSVFHIPGLNIRFGLDTILGLLPFVGDGLSSLVSFYILSAAAKHGVPKATLLRMGGNVAFDWLLGSVPFVGDAFDVFFKSNQMNVSLLRRHLNTPVEARRRSTIGDKVFVAGIILALVAVLAGLALLTVFLLQGMLGLVRGLWT